MVGNTVRVTRPSRSRPRSVNVNIRCEMLPSARRISLKRFGPSPSTPTTSTVHLSPTRASISLTARQSSGTCKLLGINGVPSCDLGSVIYLASVSNLNRGRVAMAKFKVAVIIGSNRRESVNRRLGHSLTKLGADKFAFSFIQIDDLPLYNQDLEAELPKSVARFKSEVAAADGLLFVTPEHNRSIPTVLKNAIDWGARPYGQNSWNAKPAAITGTSPGTLGTALAQQHLRQVLGVLGVLVMGGEAYISFKPGLIDAHDTVTDQATLGFLQAFIDQFGSLLDRLSLHAPARLSEATA